MSVFAGSMVLAQGPPAGAGPPGGTPGSPPVPDELIVQVDCENGESINDALATLAVELIIQISGTCIENLVIARDLVTLRGVDGDPPDGITGVENADDPPHFGNVILIRDAAFVDVKDLILEGDNGVIAVYRSGASTDEGGGAITLTNLIMEGNSEADLVILGASVVLVDDSTVGNVELESGFLRMRKGNLTGSIVARRGSIVNLRGVSQLQGIQNMVRGDSALFVSCANCMGGAIPSTLGHISVDNLSRALITEFTTLEDLTCSLGSDAFCDGTEIKNLPPVLNFCGSCP